MDLKQIKYFIEIVECGNFREAAENCYISQSAISQQLQTLESNLGYKLLIRESRKFELTHVGKYLYYKWKKILKEIEEIEKNAKMISKTEKYSIKIGYLKSYNGNELQNAILKFVSKLPEVDIDIQSGTHFELSDKLFNDELDMKITDQRRAFSNDFVNYLICTLYFFIKVPEYSKFANKEIITLDELKDKTCIIISSKDEDETEMKFYRDILGFKTDFIFARNLEEANLLVASNKGFLPIEKTLKEEKNNGLKIIPLYNKNAQMNRNYYAFWKKSNDNQFIEEFANILSKEF